MTNKDDWKVEYFPQSQWPTRARELGRVDKILGGAPKVYPLGNLGPH